VVAEHVFAIPDFDVVLVPNVAINRSPMASAVRFAYDEAQ